MAKSMLVATALASALTLSACGPGSEASTNSANSVNSAAADNSAPADAIRAQEARSMQDWASRDAERIISVYTPDATVMTPGGPRMTGLDQIRSGIGALARDPNLQTQFAADKVEVAASGDLAYTRGTYSMRSTDPQTQRPRTETGNYLSIWRRQADGSWKIVEDIISPAPVASTPADG
jgi:uncharacterized protein (TIGR02246 family)